MRRTFVDDHGILVSFWVDGLALWEVIRGADGRAVKKRYPVTHQAHLGRLLTAPRSSGSPSSGSGRSRLMTSSRNHPGCGSFG